MTGWGDSLPLFYKNFKRTCGGFNPRFEHLNQKRGDCSKLLVLEMRPVEKIRFDKWTQLSPDERPETPHRVHLPGDPINGYIDPMITCVTFTWIFPNGEIHKTHEIWNSDHAITDWEKAKKYLDRH